MKSLYWDPNSYIQNSYPQYLEGKKIIEYLRSETKKSILDIGCGSGNLTHEIALLNHTNEITGIDASEEMITYAKEHYRSSNLNFLVMNAEKMNFLHKKFDLIVSNFCLHWVQDKLATFICIKNHLKLNGKIFLVIPLHNKKMTVVREYLLKNSKWSKYFNNYVNPHIFVQDDNYEDYTTRAGLQNLNYSIEIGKTIFENLDKFKLFLKNVNPCIGELSNEEERGDFINDFIELYMLEEPLDSDNHYVMTHTYMKIQG